MTWRGAAGALLLLARAAPAAGETLEAAACAGRAAECRLIEELPAGRDESGAELSVLHLGYGPEAGKGQGRLGCRPEAEGYLLRLRPRDGRERIEPLYDFCNDGYGVAGVGEDRVRVGDNRIRHERSGGSNWRWEETWLRQLSPQRLLSYRSCSLHVFAAGGRGEEWDFTRLLARGWTLPESEAAGSGGFDCAQAGTRRHYLALPRIAAEAGGETLAEALVASGGRLGSCALELRTGGQEGEGFLLRGTAEPSSRTRVRAVLLGRRLLVEVEAPERQPAVSANWIRDDRLELWLGEEDGVFAEDPKTIRRLQLGLRLADGALFVGRGEAVPLPRVERWQKDGARLFALRLGDLVGSEYLEGWGVTLIYGEGDGKRQGLMLASSTLEYDNPATFGGFWEFPADCRLENGRLEAGAIKPQWADPQGEGTL